jgi:hypothetical protein
LGALADFNILVVISRSRLTAYFEAVAKPPLSIRTTASISFEQAAKPLKNKIADSKQRNRNSTAKHAVLLLRCGQRVSLLPVTFSLL